MNDNMYLAMDLTITVSSCNWFNFFLCRLAPTCICTSMFGVLIVLRRDGVVQHNSLSRLGRWPHPAQTIYSWENGCLPTAQHLIVVTWTHYGPAWV